MMRRLVSGLMALAIMGVSAPADARQSDPLTGMFAWWNKAFVRPDGFSKAGFDRWFTPDATLTLNGKVEIAGTQEWARHFQAIQARGGIVEIVLPFRKMVQTGNHIYTYHIIRSRSASGATSCMLAAVDAQLQGDKIASITLIRHVLDPAMGEDDPDCFHGR